MPEAVKPVEAPKPAPVTPVVTPVIEPPVQPAPMAQAIPARPARKVTMLPESIADTVGSTIRVRAICKDANGKVVPGAASYSTTDPAIAGVQPNGDVRTVNRGQCTIFATVGGTMGACHVVVS